MPQNSLGPALKTAELPSFACKRVVLSAWRDHVVTDLRIGAFTMHDTYIREAFNEPVWTKDGRGPHADCYNIGGEIRQDLIALGRLRRKEGVGLLVFTHSHGSINPELDLLLGWYEYHYGPLEQFLAERHADALAEHLETALASHL